MNIFIESIGWIGGVEVLIAYWLVSTNKIKVNKVYVYYQLLNLTGAIFLIANTIYNKAYPSTLVNIVWVIIAVVGLIRKRNKRKQE
jgi:hypothetical protein